MYNSCVVVEFSIGNMSKNKKNSTRNDEFSRENSFQIENRSNKFVWIIESAIPSM
jgi:hypothetical protein